MPLLNRIKIYSGRVAQGKRPVGNNQQGRASDVNPIIDWVNNRSDVNTSVNAVTAAGTTTAQTATINTISGTITSATLATAPGTAAITVTNSFCTTASTVLCQISSTTTATATVITSVVPGNGSFVINLYHAVAPTGTPSVKIKFIIL
jgi:hypothetical protein